MTLDFSHASLSGRDSLEMAMAMGDRLRHIHLCDGTRSADEGNIFDEHLAPGRGTQPVAETLKYLADSGWSGSVVAEVVTHKVRDARKKLALLIETVAFAREHLAQDHAVREPLPVPAGASGRDARRARKAARRLSARAWESPGCVLRGALDRGSVEKNRPEVGACESSCSTPAC